MPMYPYFGMPFVPIDPMQFNPYAMNMFPMANMLQKPIIPVIQKKLTEEEKIIEDAVANFYQKYSSTHKICECDSCEKLALPFMVKWDLNDEERIEIEKSHKEYLDELLTKNEAYRYDTSRKINNLFSKQVYLGELKFKLKEE